MKIGQLPTGISPYLPNEAALGEGGTTFCKLSL